MFQKFFPYMVIALLYSILDNVYSCGVGTCTHVHLIIEIMCL